MPLTMASAILRGFWRRMRVSCMARFVEKSPFFSSFGVSMTKSGSSASGSVPAAIACAQAAATPWRSADCVSSIMFNRMPPLFMYDHRSGSAGRFAHAGIYTYPSKYYHTAGMWSNKISPRPCRQGNFAERGTFRKRILRRNFRSPWSLRFLTFIWNEQNEQRIIFITLACYITHYSCLFCKMILLFLRDQRTNSFRNSSTTRFLRIVAIN